MRGDRGTTTKLPAAGMPSAPETFLPAAFQLVRRGVQAGGEVRGRRGFPALEEVLEEIDGNRQVEGTAVVGVESIVAVRDGFALEEVVQDDNANRQVDDVIPVGDAADKRRLAADGDLHG